MSSEARSPGPGATTGPVTGFCTGCGAPPGTCDGCQQAYDPPRFCATCGRRLTVLVSPGGYRARCRDHGTLGSPTGTVSTA